MKRGNFFIIMVLILLAIIVFCIYVGIESFSSDISPISWGWFHCATMTISVISVIIVIVLLIVELVAVNNCDDGPFKMFWSDKTDIEKQPISIKRYAIWSIIIVISLISFSKCSDMASSCVKLYNSSKIYHNKFIQKTVEKKGFYDKLWKTFLQKEKITNINKETFLATAKVIMENRADGKNVTWKWVQENQQIPFNIYSDFYSDLSTFITQQREDYFNIEIECQTLARDNNTMLDTFPNNLYNKLLNCKQIHFEYGFTSDSTESVFAKRRENVK